jgi:hypothetical protein
VLARGGHVVGDVMLGVYALACDGHADVVGVPREGSFGRRA